MVYEGMFRTALKRQAFIFAALILTNACGDDGTQVPTDDTGTGTTGGETPTTLTTATPTSDPDTGLDDTTGDPDPTDTDGDACGNGELDPGEQCDGDNLGRIGCEREGFDSGTLSCTAECTFDTSACCNDACGSDGDTQCNGDTIEVCSVGANGCLAWSAETDCSATSESCDETRGDATCLPTCVDQCDTEGASRCDADIIETCSMRAGGCLGWVSGDDCTATGQYCDDSGDAAACVCDDECTTDGALQCAPAGDAVEICSMAANGCLEWDVETTCSGDEVCSDAGGVPACAEPNLYCIPEHPNGCNGGDNIDDFIIVDSDQNTVFEHLDTGCSPGTYGDFTQDPALLITLGALEQYSFTATQTTTTFSQRIKIWIDLNEDGVFDDASELIFESPSASNPVTGSFIIPANVPLPTTTRMRVMDRFSSAPLNACDPGASAYGETHDYTVHIVDTGATCEPFEASVTNVSPADGVTTGTLSPTLTVTLDNAVATNTGVVTITGDQGTNLTYDLADSPSEVSFSNGNTTMTITPGAFSPGETVTVQWSGLQGAFCGDTVASVPWTFEIATPSCAPGTNGMVGTSVTTVATDLPSVTERYLAVDTDPNGWVYVGGTTALHRLPKTGGASQNVTTAAGLTFTHLGYDMVVSGSDIFTLDAAGGTTGLLWRISTDGGATWVLEDYASFASAPGDWLQSITAYGNDIFMMTNEVSAGVDTEILTLPSTGTPPVAASLDLGFIGPRCAGLAADDNYYYVACGTINELKRVDRTTGAFTTITGDWPLDTDSNAVHAHDIDNDGSADVLYVKSGNKYVLYVCDPGGPTPYVDQLVTYGATASTTSYGLGFDRVANRLYAYDDGPREIVVIE